MSRRQRTRSRQPGQAVDPQLDGSDGDDEKAPEDAEVVERREAELAAASIVFSVTFF